MATINTGDLTANIMDLMRQVQENGEIVEIVKDGSIVARLVPAHIPIVSSDPGYARAWQELDQLIADISPHLPEQVDAVEVVREIRQ